MNQQTENTGGTSSKTPTKATDGGGTHHLPNSGAESRPLADPKMTRLSESNGLTPYLPRPVTTPTTGQTDIGTKTLCIGNRVYDNTTMVELGTVTHADYRSNSGWWWCTDLGNQIDEDDLRNDLIYVGFRAMIMTDPNPKSNFAT